MSDRLTPEREAEIRTALTQLGSDWWPGLTESDWSAWARDLLAALDACRRDLAEERAKTVRLTEELPALVSPRRLQSRDTMRQAIRELLAECGAGTEKPA